MMLLVISAILASFALGITIAYAVCSALLMLFRMRVQPQTPSRLRIQTKVAHL